MGRVVYQVHIELRIGFDDAVQIGQCASFFQLEDDLEWTPSALQTNQRYRALAGLLYGANWLFLLGLLGLVAYKFLQ